MATAKERGHKDWGFGGVVKRDFKADKSDGEYGSPRDYGKRWYSNTKRHSPKRKKDTKRWCKGIEGREHIWALYKKYDFGNWWEYRCDNCRKELWGNPKHGFVKKISYRSNDEYDIIPVSELKS
ncbi:hypothetical protein HWB76_gp150 [Streptomyces phage Blueeyedbeauty]|uniref:Uncharacterized protein n=1 Tax=Streptomyces phage Blueeyedbeauty TaxID=2250336 RepID=A0A345L1V0_9CAUD|nr:hypothetical protein HWB76_gp150 [Streptomyces phage Blueeyedbeauty]AXH49252.1 hypothetical protein SEA_BLUEEYEDBEAUTY_131 [Streptomyces phage Blueeyedbeauty]